MHHLNTEKQHKDIRNKTGEKQHNRANSMYSILFSLLACRNALNILYHKKHAIQKNTNRAIMSKPVSILFSTILYDYIYICQRVDKGTKK